MITVEEADKIILSNIKEFPLIKVSFKEAFGKILQEDFLADRDFPPFNRVTMDGFAINFSAWESGRRSFAVEGILKAGDSPLSLKNPNSCIEIMTGAVLPEGCDCVIPIEDVEVGNGKINLANELTLTCMMNVHRQGSDHKSGATLVAKGCQLHSPQIAIAASIGKTEICVSGAPKIAVIGTGDELVNIDQKPKPHQIRRSNSYALQSALKLHGYNQTECFHIKDDKDELKTRIGEILQNFDVLVLSGGVSMGKFDYVPEVLKALGVEELFHKVRQRPGKPFWFGRNKEGKPVFALPGNPVSTQIGLYRYVLPYIRKASGLYERGPELAVLSEDVENKTALTCFLPVQITSSESGCLSGLPVFPSGSGDFVSLASSDGFVELPADRAPFPSGTTARLYRWKF